MNDVILSLKADFIAETLDVAQAHLVWASRHTQEGRYDKGLTAFANLVRCVREAATEMSAIRAIVDGQKLTGEAAAEYRRDREIGAKLRPASGQKRSEAA